MTVMVSRCAIPEPDNLEELGDFVRQLMSDKTVTVINIRELNIITDLHLKNMCDTSILEFKRD